jgi:hypothetical protein
MAAPVLEIMDGCLYRVLLAKPEAESFRKSICRWNDNIKMDLRDIRLEEMEWIHLAQNRY